MMFAPTVLALDFSSLLSTALAIVSIATLAGLGLTRGQITSLREQLADSRAETAAIRTSRAEEQRERERERAEEAHRREVQAAEELAQKTAFESKIQSLSTDLGALQKVVTGEVHWLAISDLLEHHHVEARQYWERQEAREEALIEHITANTEAILGAVREEPK